MRSVLRGEGILAGGTTTDRKAEGAAEKKSLGEVGAMPFWKTEGRPVGLLWRVTAPIGRGTTEGFSLLFLLPPAPFKQRNYVRTAVKEKLILNVLSGLEQERSFERSAIVQGRRHKMVLG